MDHVEKDEQQIRNSRDEIPEESQRSNSNKFIERRQLSWWGHLPRMEESKTVRRNRRRPHDTWDKATGKILMSKDLTWRDAKTLAREKK